MNPLTAEWANFFSAEVGASATLTGLVVVAISINLSRILSFPFLPGRAAEALVTLVGALVLSSLWLVPDQPLRLLGLEVLAIGVVTLLVPLVIQLRSLGAAEGLPAATRLARAAGSAVPSLLFIAAGLLFLSGWTAGLYWVAAGVIASLVAGVWNGWVLLIEILR
jgi:hypothetical protein